MRHRKSGRKLGRTKSHYKATLANLAISLFEHKKIKTTTAKAKELRSVAERLITFAKRGDVSARRHVFKTVKDRAIVKVLFDEIAPVYEDRNGGYTRIYKLGQRPGDSAELSIIELIGFDSVQSKRKVKTKTGKREKAREASKAEEMSAREADSGAAPEAEEAVDDK